MPNMLGRKYHGNKMEGIFAYSIHCNVGQESNNITERNKLGDELPLI